MGFLDRLLGKSAPSSGPLASLLGLGSPVTKSREALRPYTSRVYACTSASADEIATIEFRLQKKSGDTRTEVRSHPAIDLLNRVNPIVTSDELFGGTASYLDLEGNTFRYVVRNGKGGPVEFRPLRPDLVEVKAGKNFPIDGSVHTNDVGEQLPFTPKEIIRFKRFNPRDLYPRGRHRGGRSARHRYGPPRRSVESQLFRQLRPPGRCPSGRSRPRRRAIRPYQGRPGEPISRRRACPSHRRGDRPSNRASGRCGRRAAC